ncbi:ggt (nucleomorph) [Hemiselmis andersenii]|uniref:Geranylgeranyl transferase type II subunit beta n=1 Tax=Hemiselmis andersenii TaxID=464988 RepID=A9BLD5_HEMAN|nr:ggt [Hemiselmis andersenii]ABW98318.1 ggt [Hemiselmis andersenii]|mmetsp:Transcript_41733/g.101845  ORF Transcript_41733/g.101845 Transcript_41733/m.101845 type:complete len:382 (-) Transcript_41733:646-1791(-)
MDNFSIIELKNFQINKLEIFYQFSFNQKKILFNTKKRLKKILKKFNDFRFLQVLKSHEFFKKFFSKINYFSFSGNQLQSWFYFWFINAADIIGIKIETSIKKKIKETLKFILLRKGYLNKNFFSSETLLSLYSALLSFSCFEKLEFKNQRAFQITIYSFLRKIKKKKVYRCSAYGESDSRSFFCVLVISSFFNILTKNLWKDIILLFYNKCSLDGGYGCDKLEESHGALTYCEIASFTFFSNRDDSSVLHPNFENWVLKKLKPFEFGIQGRPTKLPDTCYLFWVGGISIICSFLFPLECFNVLIFNRERKTDGFSDQIGKIPDLYHSCYSICGLALCNFVWKKKVCFFKNKKKRNSLFKINPVYGIREKKVGAILKLCDDL